MARVRKVYPIENRTDFYKFTIVKSSEPLGKANPELHRDHNGDEMYFDSESRAQDVCNAINKVDRTLRQANKEERQALNKLYVILMVGVLLAGLVIALYNKFN